MSEQPVDRRGESSPASPLSGALRLYARHWRTLSAIALVAALPVALLDAVDYLRSGADPFEGAVGFGTPAGGDTSLSWVSLGLSLALSSLVTAACIAVVAGSRAGSTVDWRRALSRGAGRAVAVLVATVLVTIAVIAGLFALVLPGIWVGVALSVSAPAVVLEDATPVQGLRRSFALVRGSWWYSFGALALGVLAGLAILIAVAIPFALLVQAIEAQAARVVLYVIGEAVTTAILLPFGAALVALLFYELRDRNGGSRTAYAAPAEGDVRFRGFEPPAPPEPR